MFITLEGPDGSGKTTQAELLAEWLTGEGHEVVVTREPGGTEIGEQIRAVLHDPDNRAMKAQAEILLYAADRAQHAWQLIRPRLNEGKIVISDRYTDSTLAYQGYGRGLDLEILRRTNDFATGALTPDLTLYLDLPAEEGLKRRQSGGGEWNRLDAEAIEFHRRVRGGYLELAKKDPGRWVVIDAGRAPEAVQSEIRMHVRSRLE
jgi:dTMP kinase